MTMAATAKTAPVGEPTALIALADALTDLLERETALVRAMQIARIAPLQDEKQRLTDLFQRALKPQDATASPAALEGPARLRWLEAGRRLAAAAMENERALRVGRTATERVVAAVVTAVSRGRQPPSAYAGRRAVASKPRVAGLTFDHRL